MKVKGTRLSWARQTNTYIQTEFSTELPPHSHMLFDASQSTMVVKNAHGHVLLALKNVSECWVDGVEVKWEIVGDTAELLENLQKKNKELEAENRFLKETHGTTT